MNVNTVNRGVRASLNAYGLSLAAVAVAVVARLLLEPLLADRLPFITLFLAVGLAAWYGGRGPGLLALVAGAVAVMLFILPPRFSFAIDQPEHQVGLVLYGVVGFATVAMFESLRKAQRHAEKQRRRLEQEVAARRATEQAIAEQAERLRIKLASIGDAVITTDMETRIMSKIVRDITERRAAEDALRQSEHRMRLATKATGVGIWEWNVITGEVRWDAMMFQIFGIVPTPNGVVQYGDWSEAVLPEDLPQQEAVLDDTVQRLGSSSRHFRIKRRNDGEFRDIDCVETVRTNDAGIAEWVVGTNLDVTEKKRAEEALRQSVEEVQTLMDTLPIGVFVAHDTDCRMITGNAAAHSLLRTFNQNLSKSAPSGEAPPQFRVCRNGVEIPTDQLPVQRAARGEFVRDEEVDDVFEDGTVLHTLMSSAPLYDRQGRVRGAVASVLDITDRKRAELELVESKRKLDLAMQVGGMGAWSLDIQTKNLRGDAILTNLFGFEVDTSPPLDQYFYRIHPDDRDRVSRAVTEAIENGTTYDQEYRIDLPDGGVRWVRSYAQNFQSPQGLAKDFTGITYDMTDRKLREIDFADREAHLRRVINNQLGLVGVIDRDGILLEVDNRSLVIARARREEVIGKQFADAPWWNYDPEVAQQMRDAMRRALAGEVVRYDVSLFAHGDEGVMIDFMIAPVLGDDGEVEFLIPSGVDIRERHAAEVAIRESERLIRESEEKFRVMADGLPSLIWVHDAEGKLLFINQAYRDFYRLAEGEVLGDRWQNLVHPDDYDRYTAEFVKATEKRSLFHAEARVRSDVGEWRWVESWAQPRFSDEGEFLGYVGNSVDVTARKHNEELFEQALVDLELARKQAQAASQSKSEFLANMSHEIRTPMTAILGYAELLNGLDLPREAIEYLKTIRRNGDYLLEIINDILDLSKIEAGKLELNRELFDPSRVVEDVRSIMNVRAIENNLQLNVRYEGKFPRQIESDPKRLKQILINLVGNAIKFTKKGQVDISLRYEANDGMLQFDIIDTGMGMSDDHKSRLFKPFSQGDSSVSRHFGGTGLGLAISRRLAKMLGGSIRAESKLGEGSKFSVTIRTGPIDGVELVDANVDIETLTTAITPVADDSLLACRVLVVDDRRDIRFLSRRILSKAGATVDEAEDGQLALDFIRNRLAEGNPPALILLDMQMPNLDGYETAKLLRGSGFVGPVIALTADAMQGDMNRCLEAGCNDYMSKPIDAARLVQLVRELTGSAQNPSISRPS